MTHREEIFKRLGHGIPGAFSNRDLANREYSANEIAYLLFSEEKKFCLMQLSKLVRNMQGSGSKEKVKEEGSKSLASRWWEAGHSVEGIDWETVWSKVMAKAAQSVIEDVQSGQ